MKPDLISVIVPVYNVRNYLDKCVKSLLKQTYKQVEIILVNDGSNDGSASMCNLYSQKYENIRVVHRDNGGLSAARNSGLEVARGKYCVFVDSDDYIMPDMLEDLYNVAVTAENGLVVCGYNKVDEEGKVLECVERTEHTYILDSEKEKFNFILHELLSYNIPWEAWNKIYSIELLRKHNIVFMPNDKIFAEDLLFNLQYTLHCNQAVILNKSLYQYLVREGSIMRTNEQQLLVNEFCNMGVFYYKYLLEYPLPYFEKKFCFLFVAILYTRFLYLEKNRQIVKLSTIREKEFYINQLEEVRHRCVLRESPWKMMKTLQLLNMINSALKEKRFAVKLNYKIYCLVYRAFKRFAC